MVSVKVGNWSFGFGSKSRDGRRRPLALVILGGWGYSSDAHGNAIALAETPNYDQLCANYPKTLLAASGTRVGLLPGTPGNSETGHLNLGAGRVVRTERAQILEAIKSGEFFENEILKKAFAKAHEEGSRVHLVGQVSDGNVHSSMDTLFALLRMAKAEGCGEKAFVHAILDGRDVPSRTADVYIEALEIKMADIGCGKVATLCGRSYAMDRARNWERTARVFTMLAHSEGERVFDPITAIRGAFLRGNMDEFIRPIIIEEKPGIPVASLKDGDLVIFFNHRGDRMKQLVHSVAIPRKGDSELRGKPKVNCVCITEYDTKFNLPVAFKRSAEKNVLGEIFAALGIRNCRLAETEKYAHITYFFNGGLETINRGEEHIFVPSPKITANGTNPNAVCFDVTKKLIRGLEDRENEVFIVNLASADTNAHTGDLKKTIKAVQDVDKCLGEIIGKIHEVDGVALITSDHGHCEEMSVSQNGKISQTLNPVPFHFVANKLNCLKLRDNGALEDVAPTILAILGIDKPIEMTGNDLRKTN